jgi:hypothetical protein
MEPRSRNYLKVAKILFTAVLLAVTAFTSPAAVQAQVAGGTGGGPGMTAAPGNNPSGWNGGGSTTSGPQGSYHPNTPGGLASSGPCMCGADKVSCYLGQATWGSGTPLGGPMTWVCGPDTTGGDRVTYADANCSMVYCAYAPPAPVNGVCGTAINTCTTGTATAPYVGVYGDTHWNCLGANGGTDAACIYTPPTAVFTNTPTCTIPWGGSGCSAAISWTSRGVPTAALTDSGGGLYTVTPVGSQTSSVWIPYSSGTYQIHDTAANGQVLATVTGSASCDFSVAWNASLGVCGSNTCLNGATNYPVCTTFPSCTNGATNYPTCTYNSQTQACVNGATNYPTCTFNSTTQACVNGATNYPVCASVGCPTGMTDYGRGFCEPTQLPCSNGANNPPLCTMGIHGCLNGAIDAPICSVCPGVSTMSPTSNVCVYTTTQSCANGATNYPTCTSNSVTSTCVNGATNYPTCTITAPITWTNYCTGGADVNGNNWQIWAYDNSTPVNYKYVTAGTAANGCAPAPTSCIATTISGCQLPGTAVGSGTSGACLAPASAGSCSYTCDAQGTWVLGANTCHVPVAPVVTLTTTSSTITSGGSTSINWSSSGATSCTGVGFATGGATSGSVSVSPATTSTYQVNCGSAMSQTTVTVNQPSATIMSGQSLVRPGSVTTISWDSVGATSCAVSGPGLSSSAKTGSQSITITNQSTFTITCQTTAGTVSSSAVVKVVPVYNEF